MSEDKTGALIVIARKASLDQIMNTGDRIDAAIHRRLILNLFFKNSPLHDGALVIAGNRIVAVRCTLPITENKNLPAYYGMRHKAAVGITEESDADAVVVSITKGLEDKTGALIVITHKNPLDDIISTGDRIDAKIHRRLIMNLFFKNSPLHDGAIVISGDKIVAARCTLPITEKTNIPARFGMRHKAAIGITEETDAEAIVVSEETGNITLVKGGVVTPIQNINELKLLLNASLGE